MTARLRSLGVGASTALSGAQASCAVDAAILDPPPAANEAVRGLWSKLRASSQTHVLAFADQVMVSGASFFSTVIIGRYAHPSDLGAFTIGMSLLISMIATLKALITWPYTIRQHQYEGAPAEHAGGALVQSGLLSTFISVALLVGACGLLAIGAERAVIEMAFVLALVAPLALLREFARQFGFARLRIGQTLAVDAAVAALQVLGLLILASSGRLSAANAFAAIAAACGIAGCVWLYRKRSDFAIRTESVRSTIAGSWSLGKWLFANQILLSVQGYAAYWVLGLTDGTTGAGIYSACMSIALFANPFILAFSNVYSPRAALSWARGGGRRLQRYSFQGLAVLSLGTLLFCTVIYFTAGSLIHFLYPAPYYAGQGHTVFVLSLTMLTWAIGIPASSSLTSMEHPRVVFMTSLGTTGLTVLLVGILTARWGLVGAAWGVVAGNSAKAAVYWGAFLMLVGRTEAKPRLLRQKSEAADVAICAVLRHCVPGAEARQWLVERFGEGSQAELYQVHPAADSHPIWGGRYRCVAVKLYKPEAAHEVSIREEFQSLCRLRRALHGQVFSGWKISSPDPLYICPRPVALVMSVVPGKPLSRLLDSQNGCDAGSAALLPRALVAAMEKFWTEGGQFGDPNLDNILCSPDTREVAFVDPSVPPEYLQCGDLPKKWYPASHDLARAVYETAVAFWQTLGNPAAYSRKRAFVAALLREFAEAATRSAESRAVLDEIEACAQAFAGLLQPALSPRGAWHWVLRRIAARRIEEIVRLARRPGGSEHQANVAPPHRHVWKLGQSMQLGNGEQSAGEPASRDLPPQGRALSLAFQALDRAQARYCVTHGHQDYPWRIASSDVDILLSRDWRPDKLAGLLAGALKPLGCELIGCRHSSILLAGRDNEGGSLWTLLLDFAFDYVLDDIPFYSGQEVLDTRRRDRGFWIPAPDVEFGCTLARRIAKRRFGAEHGQRLSVLYAQDPAGCRGQIRRFWRGSRCALIERAAASGDWQEVCRRNSRLRVEMLARAMARRPGGALANGLRRCVRRARTACAPHGGVSLVLLGPDGAGKSSIAASVMRDLAGAFSANRQRSFPPGLLQRLHRAPVGPAPARPHELGPRSPLNSALRALGYWSVYHIVFGRLAAHWRAARSVLTVHDRHLVDALVDPRRYRYGGAQWLLKVIWRLGPRPDLVVLLDAPPEVLQARKQEVPFAESARQREDYRSLVGGMANGFIIDATRPLGEVTTLLEDLILDHLAARLARRLRLHRPQQAELQAATPLRRASFARAGGVK